MEGVIKKRILKFMAVLVVGIALLVYGVSVKAERKKLPIPYKAKTVEECLWEKECVWYAFSGFTSVKNLTEKKTAFIIPEKKAESAYFSKWNGAVTIMSVAQGREIFPEQIDEFIKRFQPVFPYPITVKRGSHNFMIIFVDDFDRDISTTYRDALRGIFKSDLVYQVYHEVLSDDDLGCFSFSLDDVDKLTHVFEVALVNYNHGKALYCLQDHFFKGLGFGGSVNHFPFSYVSGKAGAAQAFTDLDLFLVYLLYQPEFTPAMSEADMKSAFEKVYTKSLERFLKRRSK